MVVLLLAIQNASTAPNVGPRWRPAMMERVQVIRHAAITQCHVHRTAAGWPRRSMGNSYGQTMIGSITRTGDMALQVGGLDSAPMLLRPLEELPALRMVTIDQQGRNTANLGHRDLAGAVRQEAILRILDGRWAHLA